MEVFFSSTKILVQKMCTLSLYFSHYKDDTTSKYTLTLPLNEQNIYTNSAPHLLFHSHNEDLCT